MQRREHIRKTSDGLWNLVCRFIVEEFDLPDAGLARRCYNISMQNKRVREGRKNLLYLPADIADYLRRLIKYEYFGDSLHLRVLELEPSGKPPGSVHRVEAEVTIEDVAQEVCEYFQSRISLKGLRGKGNPSLYRTPRRVAVFLCHQLGHSLASMGRYFGRTPPGVRYICRCAEKQLEMDPGMLQAVESINRKILE